MNAVETHRPGKRMVNDEQLMAAIDAYLDYMRRVSREVVTLAEYEPVPVDVTTEMAGGEMDIGPFFVEYIQLPTGGPFIIHQPGIVILMCEGSSFRKTFIGATWNFKHGSRIETFHDVEASYEGTYCDLREVVRAFEAQHKTRG